MKSLYMKPATTIVAIETQQIMGASQDYNFTPNEETDLKDAYETGASDGNLSNKGHSVWSDDFDDEEQ